MVSEKRLKIMPWNVIDINNQHWGKYSVYNLKLRYLKYP